MNNEKLPIISPLNELLTKSDMLLVELMDLIDETDVALNDTELNLDENEKQNIVFENHTTFVIDVFSILEEIKALSKITNIDVLPIYTLVETLDNLMLAFDDMIIDVQITLPVKLNVKWWFDNVVMFNGSLNALYF